MEHIEITQGEIKINLTEYNTGKITFAELGLEDNVVVEGGHLRLVLDLGKKEEAKFYSVPTIEVSYKENVAETHWQCEYNGEVVLDKNDHFGHSTVMLLNRTKLEKLEHHHENVLIVHGDFPLEAHIDASQSFINILK